MAIYRLLTALLVLSLYVVHGQSTCDSRTKQCSESFISKYGDMSTSSNPTNMFSFDAARLDNVCRDITALDNCLEGVLPSCSADQQAEFNGVIDGHKTFCSPNGKSLFRQHHPCLQSSSLKSDMTPCVEIMKNPASSSKAEVCTAANNYLSCVRRATATRCGDDAANWMVDLIKKPSRPMLRNQIGCTLGNGEPTVKAGLITSVLVLCAAYIVG